MLNFVKVSLNMLGLCNGSLVEELGRQKNKVGWATLVD